MKFPSKTYWLIGVAITCYSSLIAPTRIMADEAPSIPLKPDGFSGVELLPKLGTQLPAAMLEALKKSGDYPELHAAAFEPGGKKYGLGIHSGGGLIVNLGKDNALLAIGYGSKIRAALPDEERELLEGFALTGQPKVTVLGDKFEAVEMQLQTYKSKISPKIHALVYSQGPLRSVVFFDSTRVEMKKLLPASPDSVDPAVLKQLRSMAEPAK